MRVRWVGGFVVAGFLLASEVVSNAGAGVIVVHNRAEFASAVTRLQARGGAIVLRPHRYSELVVSSRAPRWLTIRAQRGASAGRVVLAGTQAVKIAGLRVSSHGRHARIFVSYSRNVTFERLTLRGGSRFRANASVLDSSGVRFVESRFARCGEGRTPEGGYCLRLNRNDGVTIASSHFRDCSGCDFIHGFANADMSVRTSTFHRALVGRCGRSIRRCHHQDLVHLDRGRNIVFDRNHFGVYQTPGAAQLYLTGRIRGLTISNNLFLGTDSRVPGYSAPNALWIGNRRDDDVPRRVVIAQNTILTGRPRRLRGDPYVTATSVALSPIYARLRHSQRPVVANNVIALARSTWRMCSQIRVAVNNVIVSGSRCSSSDVRGDPALDRHGRPTAGSRIVIDRAALRFATRYDLLGLPRGHRPDIGAYEYIPPRPP